MAQNQDKTDSYLPPGTVVRYDGCENGPEYGVVVHCWFDEESYGYDCYVVFFGNELPTGKPSQKPYVLRYYSISLNVIGKNPFPLTAGG